MDRVQQTESGHRGKLKIFLGCTAGGGTARAMLTAGSSARKAGVDVVIGHLALTESDGEQTDGLERLAPLAGREFNLDGALARRPELLLLDGLARANPPGSRHVSRFQDVQELLRSGISVYTTLGIENLESLSDGVAAMLGRPVQERIPDQIFDSADRIEVVDQEPGERVEELISGETLAALREITLRRAADWLDRRTGRKLGPPVEKRIMVCLSGAPSNSKVLRSAARLAEAFHSSLTALFVETPGDRAQSPEEQRNLRENTRLAEELGARVVTVYGNDPAIQISEYARVSGISTVVLGRGPQGRDWLPGSKSLIDRLSELAPKLDIYIIPDRTRPENWKKGSAPTDRRLFSWPDFFRMLIVMAVATAVGWCLLELSFEPDTAILVYILGVLAVSMLTTGRLYSLLASLLSVVIFAYLFDPPSFGVISDPVHLATFGVMFVVAFLSSSLTTRVKLQAMESARKAYRTEVLLETSRKLQTAEGAAEILRVGAVQLGKLLERDLLVCPVEEDGGLGELMCFPTEPGKNLRAGFSQKERRAAEWVARNNSHAGAATGTFSQARYHYLAVHGSDRVQAVVGISAAPDGHMGVFENNLAAAILDECGLALEKERMVRAKQQVEEAARQEALRANLLRAISHDLRTPLTGIAGNAGVLMENGTVLNEQKKQQLYTDIYDDAMWLNTLVQNLLSITRMENGSMGLKMEPELLDEVFVEALSHVDRRGERYRITSEVEDDLLMADMDARLIVQVVINMVNNAIKYTPEGTEIRVTARRRAQWVEVSVADSGPGIPDADKKQLFEMFYTANNTRGDGRRGLGLGLSLCRSIILAHGGTISVEDNQPRGTVFCFTLRASEVMTYE